MRLNPRHHRYRRVAQDAVGFPRRKLLTLSSRLSVRSGRGVILCYHRIAEPAVDPWGLAVSPSTFDRHLQMLTEDYRVLALSELVAASRRGKLPDRVVALTFDDGYADNFHEGLPLLSKHQVPATVFVATDYVERPRRFWWDQLQDLLIGPGARPETLELSIGRNRLATETATAGQRSTALMRVVQPAFRASPPEEIERSLEALRAWAGVAESNGSGHNGNGHAGRPMTYAELEGLGKSELIEIGAHTSRHPSMPILGRDAQRAEVAESRQLLAEVIGSPPPSFSYPFGDNSTASRSAVRSCGFDYAVGGQQQLPFTKAASKYELPRVMVVEESAEELAARLGKMHARPGSGYATTVSVAGATLSSIAECSPI